jgi:hypothetical protein
VSPSPSRRVFAGLPGLGRWGAAKLMHWTVQVHRVLRADAKGAQERVRRGDSGRTRARPEGEEKVQGLRRVLVGGSFLRLISVMVALGASERRRGTWISPSGRRKSTHSPFERHHLPLAPRLSIIHFYFLLSPLPALPFARSPSFPLPPSGSFALNPFP